MKHLILIHGNPASREIWASFSKAQKAERFEYYGRIVDDLVASGELVVTHALADPSLARTATVRDGAAVTTDGPSPRRRSSRPGSLWSSARRPSGRSRPSRGCPRPASA